MTRHHDRAVEATRHLLDELAYLVDAAGIQAIGGLVEQQQLGLAHEGARDAKALLHAQREVTDKLPLGRAAVEAHDLERLVDAARG